MSTETPQDPLGDGPHDLIGHLAVCSIGYIGLVEGRKFITYRDGNTAWAWVGVSMHDKPWSTRQPRRLSADDEAKLMPLFAGLASDGRVSKGIP